MTSPQLIDLATLPWVPITEGSSLPSLPGIYFSIDSQGMIRISPLLIDLKTLPSVLFGDHKKLPEAPCIYFVIDSEEVVQYIGRSANVRARWRNHPMRWQIDINKMQGVKISYFVVNDLSLLPSLETACIRYFNPVHNMAGTDKRRLAGKTFAATNSKPSTSRIYTVRLPFPIAVLIDRLQGRKQVEWLCNVVSEAARRELLKSDRTTPNT